MRDIVDGLAGWRAAGLEFAVATVVHTWHSAPRPPGAAMAVNSLGEVLGSISGGCVEGAVHEAATETIKTGKPQLLTYGVSDGDAFEVGLTCGGTIEVLVQPGSALSGLDVLFTDIAAGRPVATASVPGAQLVIRTPPPAPPSLPASVNPHSVDEPPFTSPNPTATNQMPSIPVNPNSESESQLTSPGPGAAGATPEVARSPEDAQLERAASLPEPRFTSPGSGSAVPETAASPADARPEQATSLLEPRFTSPGAGKAGLEVVGSLGDAELDRAASLQAAGFLAQGRTGMVQACDREVFIQTYATPPRMIVFGAIDFAAAVARIGKFLGYRVTVCDARPVFATPARFPEADEVVVQWPHRYLASTGVDERTVLCVLTHDPKFDIPLLEVALRTPAGYIGAMGSRRTCADRIDRLREAGVPASALARLRAPIGLDLGARTPEETAVAIASEIIALSWGGSGTPLSAMTAPIHG